MIDHELFIDLTENYLKSLIASVSDNVDSDIDSMTPFTELGVDSFYVLKLIKQLEEDFGSLPKTLLFEHFNIHDLARYFVDKHDAVLKVKFAAELEMSELHSNDVVDSQPQVADVEPVIDTPVAKVEQKTQTEHRVETQVSQASIDGPIVALESDALKDAILGPQLKAIFDRYKNEGSVSRGTRNIAPNVFIGSSREGFFNYGRCKNILVAYAYTGAKEYFPQLVKELAEHCLQRGFEMNLLIADDLAQIGDMSVYSTPFGVIQRVLDIQNFTLVGGSMRRLRYQVSKFEKAGSCHTVEYQCGTDSDTDQTIAGIIDKWCEVRAMVNPLIHLVRQEIIDGKLDAQHRLFLTYLNDELQNVILISRMASTQAELDGYLMDLEFYPKTMPLGGLEYAIVKIIEILAGEGCSLLSLGGTYGCKLESTENADPALDRVLDHLREQKLFNDEGNMQFKMKFRPENQTIYLCRDRNNSNADNVIDIIMMIADPNKMLTDDSENHNLLSAPTQPVVTTTVKPAVAAQAGETTTDAVLAHLPHTQALADSGFNPINLAHEQVSFDGKTDSWAQLKLPAIDGQLHQLHGQMHQAVQLQDSLKAIFGFEHYVLADSGRNAEHLLYAGLAALGKKGTALQNLMFPTAIYHQIENGFTPKELPCAQLFELESSYRFKGNVNLAELEQALANDANIALVIIETSSNASGGQPTSLAQLNKIKTLLQSHQASLVIDATRVVENARFIIANEQDQQDKTVWQVINQMLAGADAVTCSLAKDFCINKGGLVSTNDAKLLEQLNQLNQQAGTELDVIDKKLVALALNNLTSIETQVTRRMDAVEQITQALAEKGIPVVQPAGGHCVLFDVKKCQAFDKFEQPVASFVAWLYANTGLRAGEHSVGMQKGTAINQLVRLAIPVGLKRETIKPLIDNLVTAFDAMANIPELAVKAGEAGMGDINTRYELRQYHNVVTQAQTVVETKPVIKKQPEPSATQAVKTKTTDATTKPVVKPQATSVEAVTKPVEDKPKTTVVENQKQQKVDEIAVIGMAGRYPQADSIAQLWQNLKDGVDSITDLPPERTSKRVPHAFSKHYRGGFVDNVDKFDSLFFNISPREAEVLDPQERLMLEVAYEVLEDAGYYPENIVPQGQDRDIGVFVGAVWAMYQMVGVEQKFLGNDLNPNSFLWSIANRVSFWMNFNGPSLTVDTACSSSLTALYLACEAISQGKCSATIVGGVNLDLHQHKFDINNAGGALSPDGYCRTFGAEANGYVAGEGVGALLLKPLAQAEKDQDNIYGVIKAATVNHGGRTSGYTVPNPKCQSELIATALKQADVDARTIGYIEAHGTGTELGDPIEIQGLTEAFADYQVAKQSCAVGSVKTNIGHLEAGAGVVGVTKVLLQMRHQQLVPSLHSTQLNPHIDFDNSPFVVNQTLSDWQAKTIDGKTYPLRAGVSSFGAGGANAHIVLEQYVVDNTPRCSGQFQIVPLSARNEEQLVQMAQRLSDFIVDDLSFDDVVFTLQRGRKSFEHRLAILAKNNQDLKTKLAKFISGDSDDGVIVGHSKNAQELTKMLSGAEKQGFIELLSKRRDPKKLAQLWIEGILNDLEGVQAVEQARRISLPTYPFADKRHWMGEVADDAPVIGAHGASIHPLVDSNESTFSRQLFKKTFSASDFVLADHIVSEIPTMPGVAYIELARKAAQVATGMNAKIQSISNVLWMSPLTIEAGKVNEAYVELKPSQQGVQFEIFSQDDNAPQVYSQGKLTYANEADLAKAEEFIDIEQILARCPDSISGSEAYPLFKKLGLEYGPSFQLLQQVWSNQDEVIGLLQLPAVRQGDFDEFELHPSILDAALQAGVAAQMGNTDGKMIVPYSISKVEVLQPLTTKCYSYVTKVADNQSELSKENILIVDEQGKILVRITESIGVPLTQVHEKPSKSAEDEEQFDKLFYSHQWQAKSIPADVNSAAGHVLVFAQDHQLADQLARVGQTIVSVVPGDKFERISSNPLRFSLNMQSLDDHLALLDAIQQTGRQFDTIAFAAAMNLAQVNDGSSSYLDEALASGVHSLLPLTQALIERKQIANAQLLYLYQSTIDAPQPHNQAVVAFIKSLLLENTKAKARVIEVCQDQPTIASMVNVVVKERQYVADEPLVRYQQGQRQLRQLQKVNPQISIDEQLPLKQRGVYLITGGAGGLGLIFAEYLAAQCQARLVLTGRSALNESRQQQIDKLKALGSEVLYVAADVGDFEQAKALIEQTKQTFGAIDGIIHSAGVLRDSYLKNKTQTELAEVIAPKVYGVNHLDQLTKDEPLEWLVTFSSLAAIGGNAGQCDYAYANHYMDSFASAREQLTAQGKRSGKTLSINWSLWADGGMKLDEQTELFFKRNLGISPLNTQAGLDGFAKGLLLPYGHLAVLEGVQHKVELAWGISEKPAPVKPTETTATASAPAASASTGNLNQLVQAELAGLVMEMLMLDASDIDFDTILLDLGFDSIGLAGFANEVNEKYKTELTPVTFFEYPNINEITRLIVTDFTDKASEYHQLGGAGSTADGKETQSAAAVQPQTVATANVETSTVSDIPVAINKGWGALTQEIEVNSTQGSGISFERRFVERPIAIVGISGSMPQCDSLDEFWDNLVNERDLVTEIPRDRWMWEDYDGDPIKEVNKSNSRWGGFMNQVDKFDPLFFGITPREAEMMDPQQRLFVEAVYQAVEDSGQKLSDLAGSKTGLFVGASSKDYIDILGENQMSLDGYSASGNSHSILANRISFLFNLRGPSAPLDTACSSSLVALHRAIESIHTGSSDMAIVGGVQVMLTPIAHISLSSAGMLSVDGKCKTFDKDANGYVRGEGCGAVFIKPLEMAQADGNPIHGVIKSTAENHGGKVSLLTAPNPTAQADLLIEAYSKAEIDPTTVGYIECHGTGTSLGDPIEIQALKSAFVDLYAAHGKPTPTQPHLGLSAVKTNIGHLEPAAGMAGMLKVLLAIKHQKIPALLHFNNQNPYIELDDSPFYIVDKTVDWQAPIDSQGNELPRRAGISSFGWGGANAHVVIEEYVAEQVETLVEGKQVIVLSARNEERLKAYAHNIVEHLKAHTVNLADFAYTLQVGRDVMAQRLAFTASSVEQAIERFEAFINGDKLSEIYHDNANKNVGSEALFGIFDPQGDLASPVEQWFMAGDHQELMAVWAKGADIDWRKLYIDGLWPQRLHLPTYPFARQRHWVDIQAGKGTGGDKQAAYLHPLVQQNASVLGQQRYTTQFNGKENWLADHRLVSNESRADKVLAPSAFVEMAAVAAQDALGLSHDQAMSVKGITWPEVELVGAEQQLNIEVFAAGKDQARVEIYHMAADSAQVHQQALIAKAPELAKLKPLDVAQIKRQMLDGHTKRAEIYTGFKDLGIDYGSSYQTIDHIYFGNEQAFAELSLTPDERFNYHPWLIDSALQACQLMLGKGKEKDQSLAQLISLEQMHLLAPCTEQMCVWVRYARGFYGNSEQHVLDIDVMDHNGKICLQLKGLHIQNIGYVSAEQQRREQHREQQTEQLADMLEQLYQRDSSSNTSNTSETVSQTETINNKLEKILEQIFKGEKDDNHNYS